MGMLQLLPWMSTRASTKDGWRLQVMCSGSGCSTGLHAIWQRDRHLQPIDAIRQQTEWLPWLLMELSHQQQDHRGYGMGKYPSMSSFLMTTDHHLPWCGMLPPNWRGTPAAHWRVASYSHFTKQEEITMLATVLNQAWSLGMRECLNKNGVVVHKEYPSPNSPDCNRQLLIIFNFHGVISDEFMDCNRQLLKFKF